MIVTGLAACGSPEIEMTIEEPAQGQGFDTTCITAIEVYAYGNGYPDDINDYTRDCQQVGPGLSSWSDVVSAMRGKFSVTVPANGLKGVEVFGRVGACANNANNAAGRFYDEVFGAAAPYSGQQPVRLPIEPIASCAKRSVTVRPVDLVKLFTTADCVGSGMADASVGMGTLSPTLYLGTYFAGAPSLSPVDSSTLLAGVNDVMTTVGDRGCLAFYGGNSTAYSMSCVMPTPPVCAVSPDTLEAPVMDFNFWTASLDPTLLSRYRGVVVGSVWQLIMNGRTPISGATVTVAQDAGTVVYVELGTGKLYATNGTSTGVNGLFLLYTNDVVPVTISAGAMSKNVKLGAVAQSPSVAMILF